MPRGIRSPDHLFLLGGSSLYALLIAVIYRYVCPIAIRAANANPVLHGEAVLKGLYVHLAFITIYAAAPQLLMIPYRAAVLGGEGLIPAMKRMFRWDALAVYIPLLLAAGIIALTYKYASMDLVENFMPMVSFMTIVFVPLYIYIFMFAVPWATAKALLSTTPGKTRLILYGIASLLVSAVITTPLVWLTKHLWNPKLYECSAHKLEVTVVNPKTPRLENMFSVDVSLIILLILSLSIYYYTLARLLIRNHGK